MALSALRFLSCAAWLLAASASAASTSAIAPPRSVRSLAAPGAESLTFLPATQTFLSVRNGPAGAEVFSVDFSGAERSEPVYAIPGAHVDALAFDPGSGLLLLLDRGRGHLESLAIGPDGTPDPATRTVLNGAALGAPLSTEMTIDEATGDLYLLQPSLARIARAPRLAWRDGQPGGLTFLPLDASFAGADLRGIAFSRATGHVHLLDFSGVSLDELSAAGEILASEDLTDVQLGDPRGVAVARTGDLTDDASRSSFYFADIAGRADQGLQPEVEAAAAQAMLAGASAGALTEAAIGELVQQLPSQSLIVPTLVRTVDASLLSPPIPDPSGIAYDPTLERLVVTDSEVEEMALFAGVNVWETSCSGAVQRTALTLPTSSEPTGVAIDRVGELYFFSDDNTQRVFVVALGSDGLFGTPDDSVSSFSTLAFGCSDPEGLGFDPVQSRLLIASGVDQEVFVLRPGANERFDGPPPAGDDLLSQFDTGALGVLDPEGIEFDADAGTIFVADRETAVVAEVHDDGTLVKALDLSFLGDARLSGVARGPATDQPDASSLYLSDRALDNSEDPNESDGKVYEIRTDALPGVIEAGVTAGSDDAEETWSGAMTIASDALEMCEKGTGFFQQVGLRFDGLEIPPRAMVFDAWIQFESDDENTGPVALGIRGHLVDDAPPFTTTKWNISSRPPTVASVAWSPPPWPSGRHGLDQRTPNLSSIVQEIVDRPGWASGNAIAFLVTGTGVRTAESLDSDPQGAAFLHVEFAPFVCGNGVTELGEGCDDGNAVTESCTYGAPGCEVCDASCQLGPGVTLACGDGTVTAGPEACDDGNTVTEVCAYGQTSCQVCDATCQPVAGAASSCGDGSVDPSNGEQCDDGNLVAGDPCSPSCQFATRCDNGADDDGDGYVDYPADPGCKDFSSDLELTQCQDGIDNDLAAGIDFDGGASLHGGVPIAAADPQCTAGWKTREARAACGLGFELVALVPLLGWLRRRKAARGTALLVTSAWRRPAAD